MTAAAERLYVAQPTVSRQLRALERQLGFDIFTRHSSGVTLTPSGEILIASARAILADWSTAVQDAAAATSASVLRIGLQTAVGRGIVGDLTRGLDPARWQVSVRVVPWEDPTAGLSTNSTDVAVLWHPTVPDVAPVRTLRQEPRCVIINAEHPLASRSAVEFSTIENLPIVALPAQVPQLRDYWIAAEQRSRPATIASEASSADEVVEAVSAGIGIALIARGNADLYQRPSVAVLPVVDLEPARLLLCPAVKPTPAATNLLGMLDRSAPTGR